jgi:hypothetical protein
MLIGLAAAPLASLLGPEDFGALVAHLTDDLHTAGETRWMSSGVTFLESHTRAGFHVNHEVDLRRWAVVTARASVCEFGQRLKALTARSSGSTT